MRSVAKAFWTPTLLLAGDMTAVYTVQNGIWSQQGAIVQMACDFGVTPTYTTTGGISFVIQGWPKVPDENAFWPGDLRGVNNSLTWPTGITQISPSLNSTGNMQLVGVGNGQPANTIPMSAFPSGTIIRLQVSIVITVSW